MKVIFCDATSGEVLEQQSDSLSFSGVRKGGHSSPILVRLEKTSEGSILRGKLMLDQLGGLSGYAAFGAYASFGFTGGVNHENLISSHLEPSPWSPMPIYGTSGGSTGVVGYLRPSSPEDPVQPFSISSLPGVDVGFTGGHSSQYVWLDVEAGLTGQSGVSDITYRFVYDYN